MFGSFEEPHVKNYAKDNSNRNYQIYIISTTIQHRQQNYVIIVMLNKYSTFSELRFFGPCNDAAEVIIVTLINAINTKFKPSTKTVFLKPLHNGRLVWVRFIFLKILANCCFGNFYFSIKYSCATRFLIDFLYFLSFRSSLDVLLRF